MIQSGIRFGVMSLSGEDRMLKLLRVLVLIGALSIVALGAVGGSVGVIVGLLGVAIAWIGFFAYLAATAQAMAIANFFIALLGLTGMGWLVIVISVLLGSFLVGFGGLLGRSLVEFIDEFATETEQAPTPVEPVEDSAIEE